MLDAYIPDGALTLEAEQKLLGACTDLLLRHEGVRPGHPASRALAWVFVHRHETYVAGAPAEAPHYKFVCQVPEGQYDEERRAAITRAMTEALVEAEDGRWPSPEARVWVLTFEVPDGTWGGLGGRVLTLPGVADHSSGRPDAVTANSASPNGVASRHAGCSTLPRAKRNPERGRKACPGPARRAQGVDSAMTATSPPHLPAARSASHEASQPRKRGRDHGAVRAGRDIRL